MSSFDSEVIGLHWYSFILVIDWLLWRLSHSSTWGYNSPSFHPFTFLSVAWPFSVASFEGKQESCLVVSEVL